MNKPREPSKILVIDDEASIRGLFRSLLTRQGYQVIVAEDGIVGMEFFHEYHPVLVITDISMPRKNGLEVIAEIRGVCPKQHILAMAARMDDVYSQVLLAGADDILYKPFTIIEIQEKVAAWVN